MVEPDEAADTLVRQIAREKPEVIAAALTDVARTMRSQGEAEETIEAAVAGACDQFGIDLAALPDTISEKTGLDINVAKGETSEWIMKDLLGRPLGRILELPNGKFEIEPSGALYLPRERTHATLEGALRSIEEQTKNVCRYDG